MSPARTLASTPPLCLVGARCVGKTTVGRAVAVELGWEFIDLDEAVVERARQEAVTRERGTRERGTRERGTRERGTRERGTRERGTRERGAREPTPDPGCARHAGELLALVGEEAFRDLEASALEQHLLARGGPRVIATGGGCVERARSRELLTARARCLWLTAEAAELARRLRADPAPRPALGDGDPAAELPSILRRREPWYRAVARWRVEADAPVQSVVARVLELLWADGLTTGPT